MKMQIDFPGGKRVNSTYKGFIVQTDQPKKEGGDGIAPEPYDVFLSSISTCAGIYVVYFCEARGIPTDGITMVLSFQHNEQTHVTEKINIRLNLPEDFPKQYRKAVVRAAESCTVKQSLLNPPVIGVTAEVVNSSIGG